jgi:hypothetical protein
VAEVPVTTPPTTTVPPVELPPGVVDQPANDGDADTAIYGWGTMQPPGMRATVEYGGTNERLSPERRTLLGYQLAEARQAGLDIGTIAEARRQGFVRNMGFVNGRGVDYINWSRFTDHLDLSKPSILLFPNDSPSARVISVAYNVTRSVEEGPPTDLPLEVIPWHYHASLCQREYTMVGAIGSDADGHPYEEQIQACRDMGATFRPDLSNWMVDLWVMPGWENPWGLASSNHPDMYVQPTPYFPWEGLPSAVPSANGAAGPTPAVIPAATGTDSALTRFVNNTEYCALHNLNASISTDR